MSSGLHQWTGGSHQQFPQLKVQVKKGDNYEDLCLFWTSVQSGHAMIWEEWTYDVQAARHCTG